MVTYNAVVLAGYSPHKVDPLARRYGLQARALIPIAGKPMVVWTVQALLEAPELGIIALVGLSAENGRPAFPARVRYVANQGDQFSNILAGVEALTDVIHNDFVLIVSADVPLLRSSTLRWFLTECQRYQADAFYTIVAREVMEAQFPGSRRTFVPLREGWFCGGDVILARVSKLRSNEEMVRDLIAHRKRGWQLARTLGLRVLLKFLLRRLTIADAEEVGARLLRARVKAIPSPHADLAMDVDRLEQLAYVEQVLERRLARAGYGFARP